MNAFVELVEETVEVVEVVSLRWGEDNFNLEDYDFSLEAIEGAAEILRVDGSVLKMLNAKARDEIVKMMFLKEMEKANG